MQFLFEMSMDVNGLHLPEELSNPAAPATSGVHTCASSRTCATAGHAIHTFTDLSEAGTL